MIYGPSVQRIVMRKVFVLGGGAAMLLMSLGLLSLQTGTLMGNGREEVDPASILLDARRQQVAAHRNREAMWASHHTAKQPDTSADTADAASSQKAGSPDAFQKTAETTTPQAAPAAMPAVRSAVEAGCAPERRPYHTLLTSSSGTYQSWQCRIMYHHFKLQKVSAQATQQDAAAVHFCPSHTHGAALT
jgi:hypothetical protein